ncbi:hypothetical protein R75461_01146 [Paraburkholderia nemoris]|uniref:hypothetical protein n=1 Tax=Paraburkholderia nemoris TaxID=2793076 RepID=UPI001B1B4421|nr:hypothetical protein [Paraburkholderia nemoris]CAE6712993.1 hypothetical protein R75461_01146 [Paraburkholderia nemoris]
MSIALEAKIHALEAAFVEFKRMTAEQNAKIMERLIALEQANASKTVQKPGRSNG